MFHQMKNKLQDLREVYHANLALGPQKPPVAIKILSSIVATLEIKEKKQGYLLHSEISDQVHKTIRLATNFMENQDNYEILLEVCHPFLIPHQLTDQEILEVLKETRSFERGSLEKFLRKEYGIQTIDIPATVNRIIGLGGRYA